MYTCTNSSLTYPNLELEAVLTFIYIITNTCHSNGVFRSGSDHAFSKPGHFSHKVNTQQFSATLSFLLYRRTLGTQEGVMPQPLGLHTPLTLPTYYILGSYS